MLFVKHHNVFIQCFAIFTYCAAVLTSELFVVKIYALYVCFEILIFQIQQLSAICVIYINSLTELSLHGLFKPIENCPLEFTLLTIEVSMLILYVFIHPSLLVDPPLATSDLVGHLYFITKRPAAAEEEVEAADCKSMN